MAEIGKGGRRNKQGNLITEQFKRPDHNDFRTSDELKKLGFSGVRRNSIANEWEIWILGERKAYGALEDQEAFEAAYSYVFALEDVQVGNPPTTKKES